MFNLQTNEMESDRISKIVVLAAVVSTLLNKLIDHFLSFPLSLFQSKSKCTIFVLVISSTFSVNGN